MGVKRGPKPKYLPLGSRWGRLTVIDDAGTDSGKTMGVFRCDCGSVVFRICSKVKHGRIRSCGCLAEENGIAIGKAYNMLGRRAARRAVFSEEHETEADGGRIEETEQDFGLSDKTWQDLD